MSDRSESFITWLGRALATYRYVVYAGGILVIILPRILRAAADSTLPLQTRRILVGGALGVMIITYLAERRFTRSDATDTTQRDEPQSREYSLYARLSLAGAVVGVAIGIYVGFAMERLLLGTLFIFGAYLFVRMGYRHEEQTREG